MTAKIVFSAREYRQDLQTVLAACDASLIGTLHKEGERRLDVNEGFYGGPQVDGKTLTMMMQQCTIGNFVGQATIELAIQANLIDAQSVTTIAGVPHAQLMRL